MKPREAEREGERLLRRVGAWLHQRVLVAGPAGNLSLRLADGNILINRSGASLGRLAADDVVAVGVDSGQPLGVGSSPELVPSMELRLHLAIYRARPDVRGVVHTHSPNAAVFARPGRPLKIFGPEGKAILGDVGLVSGAPGSEELAAAVVVGLGKGTAVLVEEHGAVTVGPTLEQAYDVAEVLEEQAYLCLMRQLSDAILDIAPSDSPEI